MKFEKPSTRFLIVLLLLVGVLASNIGITGLPPTTLSGWLSSVKQTTFNFFVPNYQATKVSGGTLIETGNKNILVNPDFEHSTFDTGWTFSLVGPPVTLAPAEETTTVFSGKKALKFTPSGGKDADLYQTSSLYASAFADGVQGIAMCRIKAADPVQFCTVQNSVISTTNCVTTATDSKWNLYKIPFILGSGNNGLSVYGTAITGDLYVDDCFVGAQDVKQDVDASRIAGESYFPGTLNCLWSRTSTTVGPFTADADCPGPTIVMSTMGDWQTTDSNLPRQTINNLPAGTYKAKFYINQYISAGSTSVISINDGTTTCEPIEGNYATSSAGTVVECTFVYTAAGDRVFEVYGASYASTINIAGGRTSPRVSPKFILEYFASGSIYSTASDSFSTDTNALTHKATAIVATDPIGTYNTFSYAASTNTKTICGTAPSTAPTSADGFKIFTRAYNAASTCGNPARVEIKIAEAGASLPTLSKEIYKSTGKATGGNLNHWLAATTTSVGARISSYDSTTGVIIIDSGYQTSAITVAVFDFSDTTTQTSGYLVINAQKKKDFIIGDFKEVVTSPGVSKPKVCSFKIGGASNMTSCTASPCTIYQHIGGCVSGVTRTSTGLYVPTWNTGYWDGVNYNCSISVMTWATGSNGPIAYHGTAPTNTTMEIRLNNTAVTDGALVFNCHGSAP